MIRGSLVSVLTLVFTILAIAGAYSGHVRYSLKPEQIADGVYVFWGQQEPLTRENGGNIANTGFIVGNNSVLVLDTGPTQLYAEEMIAAIRTVTNIPIRHAIVTHHHPDHAFGIQSFKKNNTNVYMHPDSRSLLAKEGPILLGFLETLIGTNWITGTKIDRPTQLIRTERSIDVGGRIIKILPFANGHTPGDLVVYDQETRTLFAGDLVFHGRAATVPHANISIWLDHLDVLIELGWDTLVPGHGPIVTDQIPFEELRSYLYFLEQTATESVARGDTLAEALQTEIPTPFNQLATVKAEFQRSITSLFRKLEAEDFEASLPVY